MAIQYLHNSDGPSEDELLPTMIDDERHSEPAVVFPDGLIGCPTWKRFILSELPDDSGIVMLQSLDEPSVSFVLAPVIEVMPTFFDALAADDLSRLALLGVRHNPDVELYCTVTMHTTGELTANLLGPLVIDYRSGCGIQVVLPDSGWSPRHVVPVTSE